MPSEDAVLVPTKAEVLLVWQRLRAALSEVVSGSVSKVRVTAICEELHVDKSLVSRIVRTLNQTDPLRAASTCPSSEGIRLLIDAIRTFSPNDLSVQLAELSAASAAFEDLARRFGSRRADFVQAISGWMTGLDGQLLRSARQAAYRAMVGVLGISVDASYSAYFYLPSGIPERCDTAWLVLRHGVKRLRPGPPMQLIGITGSTPSVRDAQRFRLDGEPIRSPEDCVLTELCRGPLEELRWVGNNESFRLMAGRRVPAAGTRLTFALGGLKRGMALTTATPERNWEFFEVSQRRPTREMVIDCFVHKDAAHWDAPRITYSYPFSVPGSERAGPNLDEPDAIEVESAYQDLGFGVRAAPWKHHELSTGAVRTAIAQLGVRGEDLRLFRLVMDYPIVGALVRSWFDLRSSRGDD